MSKSYISSTVYLGENFYVTIKFKLQINIFLKSLKMQPCYKVCLIQLYNYEAVFMKHKQNNVTKRSKNITLHKYTICKITLLETTNQQISKWTHHTAK